MGEVTHLWRHPVKGLGRETIDRVSLVAGRTMPWDRHWAIAHSNAKTDGADWAPCANFVITSKCPALMAVSAAFDEASETLTLRHPNRPDLSVNPDQQPQEILDWMRPLIPTDRPKPARLVCVKDRGMTDTDYPSISLNNLASHRAVAEKLGDATLSPLRWRGNIWLEGLTPWEEFDWIGKRVSIGEAEFLIREPIKRCKATTANPETGQRDRDTLHALREGWDHQNFGVYAEVVKAGSVTVDDKVKVL